MSNIESLKTKFKTELEKNIQRMIFKSIREHMVDFTVLYIRKNKLAIDGEVLNQILTIAQQGIDDGYYRSIDSTMNKMDEAIEGFIEETNPTHITSSSKKEETKKSTKKKS